MGFEGNPTDNHMFFWGVPHIIRCTQQFAVVAFIIINIIIVTIFIIYI